MLNAGLTRWLRWLGGTPCFRIYGKDLRESGWRELDVFATHRRDQFSRWPLWRGTCITWTDHIIVVGWDFAAAVLREQQAAPASRENPVSVTGGRIRPAAISRMVTASEILAHECGHTFQALRLGFAYLPLVGSVTLFREGPHWWNRFENEASEFGQFGGIINHSVSQELIREMQ